MSQRWFAGHPPHTSLPEAEAVGFTEALADTAGEELGADAVAVGVAVAVAVVVAVAVGSGGGAVGSGSTVAVFLPFASLAPSPLDEDEQPASVMIERSRTIRIAAEGITTGVRFVAMTALRSLTCILMLFACLHTGLFALTDLLVGILGHAVVTVLEPEEGKATSEQKEGATKARKSFTLHLVRGTGRGLVACVELVAAIYAFTMKRRSHFMPIAGALSIGSALLRAWDIPGERIEHMAKNLPPPQWYQVQPSGTWYDFAPSGLHALGGALVILLGVLHWNAVPPRPSWQGPA